jgi:hypothetical protein
MEELLPIARSRAQPAELRNSGPGNDHLIELLTSEDGISRTIIQTAPNGISCTIASNKGGRALPRSRRDRLCDLHGGSSSSCSAPTGSAMVTALDRGCIFTSASTGPPSERPRKKDLPQPVKPRRPGQNGA